MINSIFEFKKTDRPWHLPVLAGLCVGTPVFISYYTDNMQAGKLAALAGLVILYIQSFNLAQRMITLMTCCFGILFSFSVGISFSFNPIIAPLILGAFSFAVHLSLFHLNMTRPPGNFFFIMIASMAICMPYQPELIPRNIGYVGIGTMISCFLGLIYSIITLKNSIPAEKPLVITKDKHDNLVEAITIGFFVGISLFIANLLKLENPYWVPTSCVAIMQGINTKHVLTRTAQRILGTLVGLAFTWSVLYFLQPSLLLICICIVAFQILVEFLIVRNYAVAVVFMTALTIFIAETNSSLIHNVNNLIEARLFDILIGSFIGAIGGYILYNDKVHFFGRKHIRKTKVILGKK